MTVQPDRLNDIADRLMRAESARRPIPPLTEEAAFDVRDAYAVQTVVWDRRLAEGRRAVGHKVGLTNVAMQRQLGVDQPDYGRLHDGMALDPSLPLDLGLLIASRVEPEVAFILEQDLVGPGITVDDVLAATRFVAPSLEIIDSRIVDWRIKLADTVADNASSARFILGTPRPLDELDLVAMDGALLVDGEIVGSGAGAAVLGHPAAAVAWLADTLAPLGGRLRAGDVVLPGAMCASVPLRAGTTVTGRFEGLGEVTMTVAAT